MTDELDLLGMFKGMDPADIRELTARIASVVQREIENFKQKKESTTMPIDMEKMFRGLDDDEITQLIQNLSTDEQVEMYRSLTTPEQPSAGTRSVEEQLERNAVQLKRMYKEKSKYSGQIARIEDENASLYSAYDADQRIAREVERDRVDLQVAPLERQINVLYEELSRYQKFPSKYRDRMTSIGQEVKVLEQKIVEAKA